MKRPVVGLLFLMGMLVVGQPAYAASLYIDPGNVTLSRGDAVNLNIRLDTDEELGECVNVAEGVLTFSGPIEPVDVSLGDSIFSVWVEPPTVSEDRTQVTFAGGIPNGYCGRVDGDPRLTNNVFDVIVRADSVVSVDGTVAEARVEFTDQTVVYLNDGLGTAQVPGKQPSIISVLPTMGDTILDPWSEAIDADTIAPQPFSIQLSKDDLAFRGQYIVSFNTTDKQTGIDRYEVIEEPLSQFNAFNWGRADAPWIETRSPYVLKDQTLNSIVRVRAFDKAGNTYVATLVPDESLRTMSFTQFLSYVLLAFLVLALAVSVWVIIRMKRRRNQAAALASIEDYYSGDTNEL